MMILFTFGLGVFTGMVIVSKTLQAKLLEGAAKLSAMVKNR